MHPQCIFNGARMSTATLPLIDVRTIEPRQRHALIFSTFHSLVANEAMELVNDHDPLPLYHQFQAQFPGRFAWDYVEAGPETWRVRITRLASASGCCGGCGGGH
jgi:uncharacterized protein (DUF2249 family)